MIICSVNENMRPMIASQLIGFSSLDYECVQQTPKKRCCKKHATASTSQFNICNSKSHPNLFLVVSFLRMPLLFDFRQVQSL